jgi:hypothetical protein
MNNQNYKEGDRMKFGYRPKNTLFYERFRKNWRLKPGPRTGVITFRPSRVVRVKVAA